MLLGIGIPLLFLEMAVGQRAQQSSADMWKNLSPWFGGVGYSMVMVLFVLLLVPYSIIVCFLIRTLSMDGAEYGLKHLLILKVASISDLTIWCHAGIQVLFDIGLGFGPIVSLASHVPDFNNCMADAFLMALFKIITLLMTTPFLLSILGFWATTTTHHCCKKNQEKLLRLVAQGILPPDAQPPDLSVNPTSSYTSWLSSLPPPLRSAVLSVVPECSVQKQFLKVPCRHGGSAGPAHFLWLWLAVVLHLPNGGARPVNVRLRIPCQGAPCLLCLGLKHFQRGGSCFPRVVQDPDCWADCLCPHAHPCILCILPHPGDSLQIYTIQ